MTYSDPIAVFDAAVAKLVEAGRTRREAIREVVKADHARHRAYLEAVQARRAATGR